MLNLNYELAKEKLLNGDGHNHLKIEVITEKNIQVKREQPVAVNLCIDNSGSMGSSLNGGSIHMQHNYMFGYQNNINNHTFNISKNKSKMDYAKEASIRILESLNDDDYFGVVIFDDYAHVIVELQKINGQKEKLKQAIQSINACGSTNMYDGLIKVEEQFNHIENKNVLKKLLVLSDGEVNSGIRDFDSFASKAMNLFQKQQIQVSTIGFGRDYNLELMSLIANRGEGGFYHLKESEEIYKIIEAELQAINSVIATQAELQISIPVGFSFEENINGFNEEHVENKIKIKLGNLSSSKHLIFPIHLLKKLKTENVIIPIQISYIDNEQKFITIKKDISITITNNKSEVLKENEVLIKELTGSIYNRSILNATIEFENSGNYTNSSSLMKNNINDLSMTYNYASASSIANTSLESFNNKMETSINDKDILRELNSTTMKSLKN